LYLDWTVRGFDLSTTWASTSTRFIPSVNSLIFKAIFLLFGKYEPVGLCGKFPLHINLAYSQSNQENQKELFGQPPKKAAL
jgi:hypothetical protein